MIIACGKCSENQDRSNGVFSFCQNGEKTPVNAPKIKTEATEYFHFAKMGKKR
jgi:hypothetical protein